MLDLNKILFSTHKNAVQYIYIFTFLQHPNQIPFIKTSKKIPQTLTYTKHSLDHPEKNQPPKSKHSSSIQTKISKHSNPVRDPIAEKGTNFPTSGHN